MNIVEKLIEFVWNREYLSDTQKNLLESDFKFGNPILKKFEEEKEKEKESLEAEIEKLERELEKWEPFQGIKNAVENFVVEMKMKNRF